MSRYTVQVHDGTRKVRNYTVLAPDVRRAEKHAGKHHRTVTGRKSTLVMALGAR